AYSYTFSIALTFFFDPRIQDMNDGDMPRKDAVLKSITIRDNDYETIENIFSRVRPYISDNNPFAKMVNQYLQSKDEDHEAKRKWAQNNPEFNELAKISEIFDNTSITKFYNGLSLSLTVRACEFELQRFEQEEFKDRETISRLTDIQKEGAQILKKYCEDLENELNYSIIPIQKLVQIQIESGLLVANHINKKQ